MIFQPLISKIVSNNGIVLTSRLPGCLILAVILGLLTFQLSGADLGGLSSLKASSAKLPFYRNNQLEYFIRSKELSRQGSLILALNPEIDMVRKGVDANEILREASTNIYELYAPLETVLAFWAKRTFSQGVITSEEAEIDQTSKIVSGHKAVFLRSPMLDLNGVGFIADMNEKTVRVNSDVKIAIRAKTSDQTEFLGDAPPTTKKSPDKEEVVDTIKVSADTLFMDPEHNLITLEGNVEVLAPDGTIWCDKLDIELEKKINENWKEKSDTPPVSAPDDATAETEDNPQAQALRSTSARALSFSGNVKFIREGDDGKTQKVLADAALYTLNNGLLLLTTGETSRPSVFSGKDMITADRIEFYRQEQNVKLFGNCRIEAEVAAAAPGETADAATAAPTVITSDLAEYDAASEIATLTKNVVIERETKDGLERGTAGKLTYRRNDGIVVMEENPVLSRGSDTIRGKYMEFFVDQERLKVNGDTKIDLASMQIRPDALTATGRNDTTATPSVPLSIRSSDADFHYGNNLLKLLGKVNIAGDNLAVTCDDLQIELLDRETKVLSQLSPTAVGDPLKGGKKQLHKAILSGNAMIRDRQSQLNSDQLELFFGEQNIPGKTELEKAIASGKVKLQNLPEQPAASPNASTPQPAKTPTVLTADRGILDLLKNRADFYGSVKVDDAGQQIECDEMNLIAARTDDQNLPGFSDIGKLDSFPTRLGLTGGRELKQVFCRNDVKLHRRLPDGGKQEAFGDVGLYEVSEHMLYLYGNKEKQIPARAIMPDRGMVGDLVKIDLDSEIIDVENGDVLSRMNDFSMD